MSVLLTVQASRHALSTCFVLNQPSNATSNTFFSNKSCKDYIPDYCSSKYLLAIAFKEIIKIHNKKIPRNINMSFTAIIIINLKNYRKSLKF